MKKLNSHGFTIVEGLIVLLVILVMATVSLLAFGQITSKDKQSKDAVTTENLDKDRQELSKYVTESKTIPTYLDTEQDVSYTRKDNQTAELCASFELPRSGSEDKGTTPIDVFKAYFLSGDEVHMVYRDNVDFAKHSAGRNCYEISYTPINAAYEDRFKGDKKNWQVCDSLRQYVSRYTGQTIKGFTIGGPITTNPGGSGANIVLADDVDAYDETCTKIPVSNLDVGDKVELYIETFDHTQTQFVKAIKKTN